MSKKSKNKKQTKNKSNTQSGSMSLEKQQQIILETNKLIDELKKTKWNIFKKNEKELALKQVDDLQALLDQQQYYVLQEKLNSLKKLEDQENSEIEKEKQNSKQKKPKKTFKDRLRAIKEFDRWPLYSRTKRIIEQEEGSVRIQKLCFVYIIFVILLAVAIVGLLMLIKVIPLEGIDSANTANNYVPALVFAIPLALIFAL